MDPAHFPRVSFICFYVATFLPLLQAAEQESRAELWGDWGAEEGTRAGS